jgi:hypothetical protein
MEDLIDNAYTLFDEQLPPPSPPLPPPPTGEVPAISYGSSHTLVALQHSGETPGVDFTPQLPLGPTGSIHPSTRSNPPMSPTRLCADPSARTPPVQSIPPAGLPPRIHTTADATARESVVSIASSTTAVEKAPDPPQDLVLPPTTARERYRGEQQLAAESIPETPLTASSVTSSSLSFSD